MSLLKRLLSKLPKRKRKYEGPGGIPDRIFYKGVEMKADPSAPSGTLYLLEKDNQPPKQPKGGIVKSKGGPEYEFGARRSGHGRIIRTMPRNLRKMKEHAEKEVDNG